jgi:hypothetical protein
MSGSWRRVVLFGAPAVAAVVRHRTPVSALILVFSAFFSPAVTQAVSAPLRDTSASKLVLRIALDDSVYLPGQPIFVLASVRNEGDSTYRDLAHLAQDCLRLHVFRDSQRVQGRYLRGTFIYPDEGPSLAPGGELCEIQDLLPLFSRRGMTLSTGSKCGWITELPPGRYAVSAYLRTHLLFRGAASFLVSERHEFVVLPPSSLTASDERALKLLESLLCLKAPRLQGWNDARLRGLESSRYLSILVGNIPFEKSPVGIAELADAAGRSGAPLLRIAGLLSMHIAHYRTGLLDEGRTWLREVGPSFSHDPTLACLFQSWDASLREYPR